MLYERHDGAGNSIGWYTREDILKRAQKYHAENTLGQDEKLLSDEFLI